MAKSIHLPSFIRPAELMGEDIQAALSTKADEVADMIASGIKGKNSKALQEAKEVVSKLYKSEGLNDKNRARLVRILNKGADEVADSALLKSQRPRINAVIDNVAGVVQKSSDSYIDRIVMRKVGVAMGKGASKADIVEVVRKSMTGAEHYWKNVSNTATSRLFHYGSMLAAEGSGLTKCTYHAVVDDRTTDFCKSIDGKTIKLSNALTKAEAILGQTTDEMMESDYWKTAEELGERGSTALVTNGLTLPPFHGHCRTTTWFS